MKRTKICAIFTIFFAIASTIAYSSQTMSYNENSNKINAIAVANEPVNTSEVIYRAVVLPQEINEDFDILTPCGYTQTQLEQAMQGEYYKETTKSWNKEINVSDIKEYFGTKLTKNL